MAAARNTGMVKLAERLDELKHDPLTWVLEAFRWGEGVGRPFRSRHLAGRGFAGDWTEVEGRLE